LDENKVIEYLCIFLENSGWSIQSRVAAGVRGIDVIALNPNGKTVYIEAKGGTSSSSSSSRYGSPYTQTQVFDVTSKGLMQSFHHLASSSKNVEVGFAYPDGKYFRKYMDPIKPMLASIGLTLFCVKDDKSVEISQPNRN